MKKHLTWLERKACLLMSHLKYNEDDQFYKCCFNDIILNAACVLLGGRNPIDFAINVGEDHMCKDEIDYAWSNFKS